MRKLSHTHDVWQLLTNLRGTEEGEAPNSAEPSVLLQLFLSDHFCNGPHSVYLENMPFNLSLGGNNFLVLV